MDLRKLSGLTDDEEAYMVVINNVKEFNVRFKKACKELNLEFIDNRIVSYYDELSKKSNEIITPFMKRNKYKKQQEVRYLVHKSDCNPIKIYLGSLKDIAHIYNVKEMCINVIGTIK